MHSDQPRPRKPTVHRKPVLATIRQLYGTAFRCGKPDCNRPLYKMDNETGTTILNSNVSHICARSEGGPRWDPEMSEEHNRAETNLIPMCLEHALEIDTTPERYPVDILQDWKRAQIAEHVAVQKGWPLTDGEAEQVIESSFDPMDYGVAVAAAASVTAAARAVGQLTETARQQRHLAAESASTWQAMRRRVQNSLPPVWDSATGELLLPGEPAFAQTRPFQEALDDTLQRVMMNLQPLMATLIAELHAVATALPQLSPWCDWVETTARKLLAASGRWPGRPPEDDDDVLADTVTELLRASAALTAAGHGQPAEPPPEPAPPAPEAPETGPQRRARQHHELLDRARPWARVTTRPYDAELYTNLVRAARFALDLPELPMYLSVGLAATTGLAAEVARNADDTTFAALLDGAAAQQPLAIAVSLVRELMFMAETTRRPYLEAAAQDHAQRLLRDADWSDQPAWEDNRFQVRRLLGWTASISTADEVRDRIAAAATARPELLEPVLLGISEYSERRHRDDWSTLLGIDSHIETLPAWFPTSIVAAQIRRRYPDLKAAHPRDSSTEEDQTRELAAQVLRIEAHSY